MASNTHIKTLVSKYKQGIKLTEVEKDDVILAARFVFGELLGCKIVYHKSDKTPTPSCTTTTTV